MLNFNLFFKNNMVIYLQRNRFRFRFNCKSSAIEGVITDKNNHIYTTGGFDEGIISKIRKERLKVLV